MVVANLTVVVTERQNIKIVVVCTLREFENLVCGIVKSDAFCSIHFISRQCV